LKKLILYSCFLFNCVFTYSQNTELILNPKWEFRQKGTDTWYLASVPGTVHTDLFANKLIPDPFFSDNEKKVQWIENEDWEYKSEFTCDKKTISQNNIELKFEGLDTYAKIYLNKKLILETNNMFRSWLVNIKKEVKEGNNTLLIVFESVVKKGKALASKLSYTLPGEEKIFTRKAQYQYGWDWGPRLVTCGIYKPIKLITWNKLKIESIYAHTKEIKDTVAKTDFIFEILCDKEGYYDIRYNISTKGRNREQSRIKTQLVSLKSGINTVTISTSIPNPNLWWCNNMGKRRASLYSAAFKIVNDDSLITQESVQFGIRTIELVQEKDSVGSSFYFKLNDVPVFMKGANYIPQHSFLPNLNSSNYREIITMAKDVNMNMLRVWGGGVYGDEEFYKDCDRAGILVWQDFMFACAMYPGDKSFIENVKQEATEQVKKLRNHPCIALWCGNNEISEGWYNWGWQKQYNYSKKDSAKIWKDYENLFQKTLPEIVKQNDFQNTYWPSSPSIGWGRKESLLQGDSHYWGVWWGNEPFELYEKKVGRFMSEYGFQSMPSLSTFKTFCDSVDLNFNSAAVQNHQKHPTGYQTIRNYMERDFFVPKDFEKFIYVSQLVQAQGMKTAIESHRIAKPYCMGTLFWQLNDCWPVTSWSAIDFQNQPKAFLYHLKDLYANVAVVVKKSGNAYTIHVVNDNYFTFDGRLTLSIKDFSGTEILSKKLDTKIISNSASVYFTLEESEIPNLNPEKMYLSCTLQSNDEKVNAMNLFYFTSPKNLKLSKPNINLNYSQPEGILTIKSDVLVKNLYMYTEKTDYENNYFDLEPGREYQIKLKGKVTRIEEIKFMSLNDINH
jgi:beta-mannosidase